MIAIADLAEGGLAEGEGRRAAFYLLIWPGSVFLAQVYSEGLFLGLSFGALALMRRRSWWLAPQSLFYPPFEHRSCGPQDGRSLSMNPSNRQTSSS
jgi:hypothetical protein